MLKVLGVFARLEFQDQFINHSSRERRWLGPSSMASLQDFEELFPPVFQQRGY